jgi:hypothetical protein
MVVSNEPNYFLNVDKKFSQSPRMGDKKYKSFPHGFLRLLNVETLEWRNVAVNTD